MSRTSPNSRTMIESLEPRTLLAVTPAGVLTTAMRQALANSMKTSTIKTTLQTELSQNDNAGFDQALLDYMRTRTNAHFFFALDQADNIASFVSSNIGDGGAVGHGDSLVNHQFPLAGDGSYSVDVGSNIDWVGATAGYSSDAKHKLNQMRYWSDLSEAYNFSGGDASYSNELISELASWSAAFPTVTAPTNWSKNDQRAWLLDTGVRVQQWCWSYFQLLGASSWSKEANTLFLVKVQQQIAFLATQPSFGAADNRQLFHASGWLFAADSFPEFSAANVTGARQLAWDYLNGAYYDDGSHHEQSPGYASTVGQLLELKYLDSLNGFDWDGDVSPKLTNAVNAIYQFLAPDGNQPALGDTYRTNIAATFLTANEVLGVSTWPSAKPRAHDAWLFGVSVASANMGNPNYPTPGDRGTAYAMPDSGNYIARSADAGTDTRQLLFHAGPKGGQHGHYDPMSFELYGYGRQLISDPGLVRYDNSADRTWAVSTPAHNTVSIDNQNVWAMNDLGLGTGTPAMVVDQWTNASDHVQVTAHHFGYDFLSGKPVVSRSIWYDKDGTILIVDWAESLQPHTFTTNFLLPGSSYSADVATGRINMLTGGGLGNVKVQALLRDGQTATRQNKFASNQPPPNEEDPAQRFSVSQTTTYAVFATLITAYDGTTAPNITASFAQQVKGGQPVKIALDKNGSTQTITFTPPALQHLAANGANNGSYVDVSHDKNGNLHMAWYDRVTHTLKYSMRDTSGRWSVVEEVDNGLNVGIDPSIRVNSVGNVGIAYYDANKGDLKYASFKGAAGWNVEVADGVGNTGSQPSLVFSRTDTPTISYYDRTNKDLRLAIGGTNGGWTLRTIDAGATGAKDVGKSSQVMLDPSRPTENRYAIAYEDTSAGYTMYAVSGRINGRFGYDATNNYSFFHVDKSTGGYISLAYDGSGRASISHYQSSTQDLRFAKSNTNANNAGLVSGGLVFTASTIASAGSVGQYSAHYYDSTGKAVVMYFDQTRNKFAKARLTSAWAFTYPLTGGKEIHVSRFGANIAYTNMDDNGVTVLYV